MDASRDALEQQALVLDQVCPACLCTERGRVTDEGHRQTDRQTDRQTVRHTHTHVDTDTDGHTDTETQTQTKTDRGIAAAGDTACVRAGESITDA